MLVDNITGTHTPDILDCLSNLSSDEVFTPPKVVNEMLDLLPKDIWQNPKIKFLDPACKSGVFLREIAKRLLVGLKEQIPNEEKRKEHIYKNMIYGIAITELTSLISRRSLYYTKDATNPKYSVVKMPKENGNIVFSFTNHEYKDNKCIYCGVSKNIFNDKSLENHAYKFIHKEFKEEFKDMKFDVIIGNPPYQLNDGGGRDSGAIPLYHKFIEQAKSMNPKYISMIIPARWYSGGKGLDDFRNNMLNDTRIEEIHDFPETSDCFPGINIRGGVCFFLWNKNYKGDCLVKNYKSGEIISFLKRPLLEKNQEIFVRYNEAINILNKVKSFDEKTYVEKVSARKPFGINSNFKDYSLKKTEENKFKLYRVGGIGYINEENIIKNKELVPKIKVLVSKASPGGDTYPHKIISEPIVAEKNSCCTETYLIVDILESLEEANNLVFYMKTRFFRFLMSLIKNTQNITRGVFLFVPIISLDEKWTDEKLYKKYDLNKEEIEFIESMIKEMN